MVSDPLNRTELFRERLRRVEDAIIQHKGLPGANGKLLAEARRDARLFVEMLAAAFSVPFDVLSLPPESSPAPMPPPSPTLKPAPTPTPSPTPPPAPTPAPSPTPTLKPAPTPTLPP